MPRIQIAKEDGLILLETPLDPTRSYTLGRSSGANIRLEAPSISRLHAVLFVHGDAWTICDLGSTRGLWTQNGQKNSASLGDGDWVAIGPAFVWFFDDQSERSICPEPLDKVATPAPAGHVLLVEGPEPMCPQAISLDHRRSITIGTDKACDVVVGASDLELLHVNVFPYRDSWHVTAVGEADLLPPSGFPTRTAPLEPENTVFAGSLSLSLLPIRTPSTHIAAGSEAGLSSAQEQMMVPAVDLEAAARSGRTNPPERPAAA